MNTHDSTVFNSEGEISHFRRFLPAPLAEAAQRCWGDNRDGAKEHVAEFMIHLEQFEPISAKLAQRLTYQVLNMPRHILESDIATDLMNLIHLAAHNFFKGVDEWIGAVTGVSLAGDEC